MNLHSHFEVVFVVGWHQIEKLVRVVLDTFLLIFAQIQLQLVISSYIEDNETILLIGKRFLCVLYDNLKRLSAKIFVESLFNRLFRVDAFGFTLTILVV